jgi:magnesium transporter
VDNENHILGTIKTEELLSYTQEEATEDIQKMFGAGGDEKVFSPIWLAIRKRLPWLYINLGTAFLAAFVIGFFENIIAQITILAVFLPIVAGQGGNAGAQTLAIVIRGLALKEVSPNMAKRVVLKEGVVGIINGIAIGTITALIAWLWNQNPFLGVIIGLAMIVNMVAAGISGAIIPLTMKYMGWDPAQSSSIFVTTVTDVVGFASFLGFAVLFQHYLL